MALLAPYDLIYGRHCIGEALGKRVGYWQEIYLTSLIVKNKNTIDSLNKAAIFRFNKPVIIVT